METIYGAIITVVGGLAAVLLSWYLEKKKKENGKSKDKPRADIGKARVNVVPKKEPVNAITDQDSEIEEKDDDGFKKSCYVSQKKEDTRLAVQNQLLNAFDYSVYENTLNSVKPPLVVLDVGCGTGDMIMSKLKDRIYYTLVGIDCNDRQLDIAKSNYQSNKTIFVNMDVEAETFEQDLDKLLEDNNIDKFNIINISMVLLHLAKPCILLQKLFPYLEKNGKIIIRDIDDGINFAYPDPQKAFERLYKLCYRDEQSGYRKNGRRIYQFLHEAGYKDISLQRQGLSSDGMNEEQKEAFFNMYFKFVIENAETMYNKYRDDKQIEMDFQWAQDNREAIFAQFMEEDFLFSLGFMTYVATKK